MSPTTKERELTAAVRDVIGDMQTPGASVTIRAGDQSATLEDPREICLEIARKVEHEWRHDEHLLRVWPVDPDGQKLEYEGGYLAAEIAGELIARIVRLQFLSDFQIGYLYRYKENWEDKGRTVYGRFQKANAREAYYSDHHYEVVFNWLVWKSMTPWQKVALVYHELRHGELTDKGKPATQGHDWEGFFDELELFGTRTYEDWALLAKAAYKGDGVVTQYDLRFEGSI